MRRLTLLTLSQILGGVLWDRGPVLGALRSPIVIAANLELSCRLHSISSRDEMPGRLALNVGDFRVLSGQFLAHSTEQSYPIKPGLT